MTQIKVCGITRIEDALAAAECGADALGFIFHEASPRFIAPGRAREIIAALPAGPVTVGVFVNREAAEVMRIAEASGIDLIQLHGDETPAYCRLFPPERVIKALFPRTAEDLAAPDAYEVRAFLADSRDAGRHGGTGRCTDWPLAALMARRHPLILAGGLNLGNIGEAIAGVDPAAVDLNSGIEQAPGLKDHGLMARIIDLIRSRGPAVRGRPPVFARRRR
jgi:phosphoribosylanthranilate isomerase